MTDTDPATPPSPPALCPSCGAIIVVGDSFCEACGADLPVAAVHGAMVSSASAAPGGCTSCGGPVSGDGYCEQCGMKQPDPHDHEEIDLGWAAGVTDRGHRHSTNEDAMAVVAPRPGMAVAVVCDGVSSSSNAQQASKVAVAAAISVLLDSAGSDAVAALTEGAARAQTAVESVTRPPRGEAPSCTFVAAIVHDGEVTVGWVGDSRAYWLGAGGDRRLTIDDSWAADQVAAGLSEELAEADSRAHGITRWLGTDAPDTVPRTESFRPNGPGLLVVCSDGLWNYASAPSCLNALVAALPAETTPIETARHLTDFALESGGQDNVTVVVVAV